jgi:predicted nucleotidyltransferase
MIGNLQILNLRPSDQAELSRILERYLSEYEIWAFGSRAKGTAKAYSDLDLAIVAQSPLPLALLAEVRDAFAESDLTIKVDLVDLASAGAVFRKIVEGDRVVVQTSDAVRA